MGSAKWERLNLKRETAACRRFSQIFADLVLDLQGKWFGAAEKTAGNRRRSHPFSHSVSPVKRNLVRKSAQNVEKISQLPGGEKSVESCHVSGCHVFFGPEEKVRQKKTDWTRENTFRANGAAIARRIVIPSLLCIFQEAVGMLNSSARFKWLWEVCKFHIESFTDIATPRSKSAKLCASVKVGGMTGPANNQTRVGNKITIAGSP